ncbi:hypothetical protein [Jannaschia faecimaris]|uniref:hypothetical protein n=1 Tax=Jannaschia faecimaris TaxID=1244108 RepID=UPI001B8C8853|nr:hypothetical protein [Jannaschia faecimaris]
MQAKMTDNLAAFSTLVRQGTEDDGAGAEDQIKEVEARMTGVIRALKDIVEGSRSAKDRRDAMEAERSLQMILQVSRTLGPVITLARTISASVKTGRFEVYLADLGEIADRIETVVGAVVDELSTLDRRRGRVENSCDAAAGGLQGSLPFMSQQRAEIAKLSATEIDLARDIDLRAAALSQQCGVHLKAFIVVIQFSDRMAQRLDHLKQICDCNLPGLNRLRRGQASDIASDIRDTRAELRAIIEGLTTAARGSADLFSSGEIAGTIEQSMNRQADMIDTIGERLAATELAFQDARLDVKALALSDAAVTRGLDSIKSASRDIRTVSINSALMASQSGTTAKAQVVLSAEVQEIAKNSVRATIGGSAALERLTSRSIRRQEAFLAQGEALALSMENIRSGRSDCGRRLTVLFDLQEKAGEETRVLLGKLSAVVEDTTRLNVILAELDALAALPDDDAPPAEDLIDWAWALYTMDQERAVHAALYSTPEGHSSSAPEGDDIDDLLF